MNKKILITLTFVAVLVYGRLLWIVLGSPTIEGNSSNKGEIAIIDKVVVTKECAFTPVKRDPFKGKKPKPKPKPKVEKKVEEPKPKVVVKPPNIKINGIMWNSTKPLAMIQLPNGSSQMVKAGDEILGRITVKKVEKNRVQVLFKETLFWIER